MAKVSDELVLKVSIDQEEFKQFREELAFLQWFYCECDFGPAHSDVVCMMNTQYKKETGNDVPENYDTGEY